MQLLGIFNQIDPDLATLDKRTFAEGMRNLSNILDANSEILVQVGQSGRQYRLIRLMLYVKGSLKMRSNIFWQHTQKLEEV